MNYRILTEDVYFTSNASFVYEDVNITQNLPPHKHTFFEIFLTLSDNYRHFVKGTTQILPLHSLVFVRETDLHENLFPDIAQHHIQFLIKKDEMLSFLKFLNNKTLTDTLLNTHFPPTVQLNQYDYSKVIKLFDRINLLNIGNIDEVNLYCKKVLTTLFVDYFSSYSITSDKNAPMWLENALEITNTQKLFIDGIDKMIEKSGKSYEHFSRILKEYYNITPSEYINDLRVNYAANLCKNTRIPITDICFNCGFNNISYFYTQFKNKYGCTPLEFRKRYVKH